MTTDHAPSDADTGALAGLRVLEIGDHVSAPFAAKLLAGYGADVIKIEPPGSGDSSRRHGPFPRHEPHPERSALFLYLNTNKRSLTLDLTTDAGRRIFRELVATADAVVENTKPETLAAWDLAYDDLIQIKPSLVLTSVTPFGQTGPYAGYDGPNLVALALGGQMHMTGEPDREPLKNGGYQADYQAGLNAFSATAIATYAAATRGRGEHVDVGAMQCQASVLEGAGPFWCYLGQDTSMRRGNIMASFIGIYPCADGQIGIHAMASNWDALMQVVAEPAIANDDRFATQASRFQHNDELTALFYAWAAGKRKREVYARAGRLRGPIAYVHSMQDLLDSPQLQARGFLRQIDHPATGPLTYVGPPFQMSQSPARDGRAPLLGEHTTGVLSELGYDAADQVRLRAAGVI